MTRTALCVLGLALLCGAFFVYARNSGYGYDALEYLVIGRSLVDGYSFYDFIPSKSCGLYYVTAFFLRIGWPATHAGVAALVTLLFALAVGLTFAVVRRSCGPRAAPAASALVALCAVFMEMNYLEPEMPVYLFGLLAFAMLLGAEAPRRRALLLALSGLWIGFGVSFKTVAAFYYPAALLFAVTGPAPRARWRDASLLTAGLAAGLLVPLVYFGLSGRLGPHLRWTYVFPLLHRPADTFWLPKLFTKLLWLPVLLVITVAVSLRPALRDRVYGSRANVLALLMGLAALAALLKQQASHYVFPGAAFLSIFTAAAWCEVLPRGRRLPPAAAAAALVLGAALVASVALYRPAALRRFAGWKNFAAEEDAVAAAIREGVPPEKNALLFRKSTLLYWITHRYPNVPLLKTDVQETYYLRNHPGVLQEALRDPDLLLVEYDPAWPGFQDRTFPRTGADRDLMRAFEDELEKHFAIADTSASPYVLWKRATR